MKNYSANRRGDATRLLVAGENPAIASLGEIENFLEPRDLIVVNQSGTIPASHMGRIERTGEFLEVRLAVRQGNQNHWLAVIFGSGSWRDATEERGPAPKVHEGDRLLLGEVLRATVKSLDERHPRLVHLSFEGDLYRSGRPIQYSYHAKALTLWDTQTPLASSPWSVEAPSALFPLTTARLLELNRKHKVVALIHGAGLSSTGDEALDSQLPFPEPFLIPKGTFEAVEETQRQGGRVLAWGTSVARALETAFENNAHDGISKLRLGRDRPARLVDGLITGFHEPGTSHYSLEEAFLPKNQVEKAFRFGQEHGLVGHEFGDLVLLWRAPLARASGER
jgi:S-adenosylmethionine:tRNA ribosyltransferase-isomerase